MGYKIDLEVFSGPMDLLLYLVSKQEVDLQEVSLASIVDQYLEHVERMQELDVDLSSDFMVMASTLMLIKSKMLLPTEEIDLDEEIDQQDNLLQHLMEYKKIKVLSRGLKQRGKNRSKLFCRPRLTEIPGEEEIPFEELSLWDILGAFSKIMSDTGLDRAYSVIHSDKPLSAYMNTILGMLQKEKSVAFESFFEEKKTRSDAISFFVGILELVKQRIVTVVQKEDESGLFITLCMDEEELNAIKQDGEYRIAFLGREGDEEPAEAEDTDHPFLTDLLEEQKPGSGDSAVEPRRPREAEQAQGADEGMSASEEQP